MDGQVSFGCWLEKRRKALDLTREELAQKVSCSTSTLRKIESDERRPSKQLAELIADALDIRMEERATFLRIARGDLAIKRMKFSPPLPALSLPQSYEEFLKRIPIPPTSLIGREAELVALNEMIHDPQCRLITLFGSGGIGKTRLAIETAIQQNREYSQAVAFVSLASLSSVSLIVHAIADALRFSFRGPGAPKTQLIDYLREKNLLMVLDNFEHLLDGVDLLTEVIRFAPNVKILCTSREQLNVQGEWVFEVKGLSDPDAEALFVNCAHRRLSDFSVNEVDRRTIIKICRLVEGMPLAIELAATWLSILSLTEIEYEMQHNLDFLSTTIRDLPDRHRSMRAVFEHSWKLLTVEERQALSWLSVFRGGFTREMAEQVAGASLAVLSSLVSRSLVQRIETGRYALHELVRQYSCTQLEADPQTHAAVQKRHYDFFLALAEAAENGLKGRNQLEWLVRLEQELDNLRAALAWALERDRTTPGGDELALRLSGSLRWFWRMRGYLHEGNNWLTKPLQQCPEGRTVAKAVALLGKSLLLFALGDLGAARLPAEESAAIYRELGDQHGLAEALTMIGLTLVWQGEANLGLARLEEALAISRQASDRWGEAHALYRLGSSLADYAGDPKGRAMLEESAAILEELREKYVLAGVLISLGIVEMGFGDYAAALARFEHGLVIAREIEHPWGMADALTNLGCVYRILGDHSTAQSHLEQALHVYQKHGRSIWGTDALCALAENALSQGDLVTARFHLQSASNLLSTGENKWLQMLVCYFRGLLAYYEGDAEAAMTLLDETIALAKVGQYKPDLARALIALGRVLRSQGDAKRAVKSMRESLDLYHQLDQKLGMAISLEGIAGWASEGDGWQAAKLFGVAEAIREAIGAPMPLVDRPHYESDVESARAQLGEEAVFACAWAEGKVMPLEQAIDFALGK